MANDEIIPTTGTLGTAHLTNQYPYFLCFMDPASLFTLAVECEMHPTCPTVNRLAFHLLPLYTPPPSHSLILLGPV